MPFAIPSDPDANSRNLSRLCLLRAILIVVLAAAALLSGWLESVPLLQDRGILIVLSLLTAFNVWSLWRLRRGGAVSEAELFVQLVVDVLLMTLVFYRTGGSTNPFVSWYLVPLTIAAATLRIGYTIVLALLTLAVYSLLLVHYIPFAPFAATHMGHMPMTVELAADNPHAHHMTLQQAPDGQGSGFNLHVFGMWLNFILSAALISFFVTRMSGALREQDRQLARQHENLLQREQVVALGALAAGAAHELGTPLSTMAILARDIESDLPPDSPLRADMATLRRQLALCREILGDLREQAAGLPRLSLEKFVMATVERMEVVHPERQFHLEGSIPEGSIEPPATLQQVLVNLLDNAAQAARSEVRISVRDAEACCLVDIDDDGPGIAPEIASRLGQAFVTDKDEGMGLGYFLSHASINQMGGSIHFKARAGGGTRTELRLPWAALQRQSASGDA
ncbi:MAG: ATP-binding protein [Pedobacter sp.]|nr:ATP-binding protein [Pedobacter sp.]